MYKNFTNKKGTEYSGNVILGFDNLEVTNELLKDCTNWDGVANFDRITPTEVWEKAGILKKYNGKDLFGISHTNVVNEFQKYQQQQLAATTLSGFQQPCAQCKYCNYEINTVIGKCVAHFKICSRVSITILQGYFGPNFQPNSNQHNNSCLPIEQNTVITTKHLQNSSINNFVDRISLVEQAKAELLFAQTIYQCKLFLSLPELEPIKALFKKLHPLDNIINSADYICLVSDGCQYFSAHQTGEIRQTGENITEDIENTILQIDYSKLSAVITDNASSMKKAWKLVAIRYPNVVFIGCVAHSLNLLIGDIMNFSWADTTMKNSKRIVNNQLAIELTITLLSRNQAVNIDEDIKNIVQDNGFWEEVGDLFRILNQLVIGISIFESDTPCLSGVLDWYYDQLESSVEDHIKDILEKRWKSIYHPIMESEELDKNLLDGDIEFIENENEESEYSNSSSSENEKRNQESDDLYDSD
ncbi:9955_t:CDS:2, partial [Entrophospora sp. SA101]